MKHILTGIILVLHIQAFAQSRDFNHTIEKALLFINTKNDTLELFVNEAIKEIKNIDQKYALKKKLIEQKIIERNFENSDSIFETISEYYTNLSDSSKVSYNGLNGHIHYYQGRINQAANSFHTALFIAENIELESAIVSSKNNLGSMYTKLNDTEKGKYYFEEVLAYYSEKRDTVKIAKALNNLGIIFSHEKEFNIAQDYFIKALKISNKNEWLHLSILLNLAINYEELEEYEAALKLYNKVLMNYEKLNISNNISILMNKAICLKKMNRYKESREIYKTLISNYFEPDSIIKKLSLYLDLSELNVEMNDFKSAYNNHVNYVNYYQRFSENNSIFKLDSLRDIYELQKKQHKIEILQKTEEVQIVTIRKQQFLLFGSIFSLIGFSFGIYYLIQRNKKERELFESEVKSLKRENQSWLNKLQSIKNLKQKIVLGDSDVLKIPKYNLEEALLNLVYISAYGNYLKLHFKNHVSPKMIRFTLSNFESEFLPDNLFVQINRSSIININYINSNSSSAVKINFNGSDEVFPIGRKFKKDFKLILNDVPNEF